MTLSLFPTNLATAPGSTLWRIARDGDPVVIDLHSRHYSARTYADGRPRRLIVGPGEKLVLVARDDRALFVWRRMAYTLDGQRGICCAVFRREAGALASDLIREADALADDRWPGVRHYTYVAPSRVGREEEST